MPDFTLPVYQGGELTLSSLHGKNVLILFPRGYAAESHWCTICNYRYVELVELEAKQKIRKNYNLEILFVLPYGKDTSPSGSRPCPTSSRRSRTGRTRRT